MILVIWDRLKAIHRHFDRALSTPVTIINNVSDQHGPVCRERISMGILLKRSPAISPGCAGGGRVSALLAEKQQTARHTDHLRDRTVWRQIFCALLSASIPQALEIDVVACDYDAGASTKPRAGIYALRRTGDSRQR